MKARAAALAAALAVAVGVEAVGAVAAAVFLPRTVIMGRGDRR